jgi:hypothetical protein
VHSVKKYDLLGCNAVYFGRSLQTFGRNLPLPYSGLKRKLSNKSSISGWQVAGFVLGLLFEPEDGSSMFL